MKILLVSNQHQNSTGIGNPIMYRMRQALETDARLSVVSFYPFYNNFNTLKNLRKEAAQYDLVHIHFGGMYAIIVYILISGLSCKKIITFHGTDIHAKAMRSTKSILKKIKIKLNQWSSFLSILLYDKCGFVSNEMIEYIPSLIRQSKKNKFFHQPLGVDYRTFMLIDQDSAISKLKLKNNKKYILFSDVSNTSIKRRDIASAIVNELGDPYELLVMSGVKASEVPIYINACTSLILTSDEEGSPNIIRETLALNKPVFSVNVGDAALQLHGLKNSAVISRCPKDAATLIARKLSSPYTDMTRQSLQNKLDFEKICESVIGLYLQ